MMANQKNVARFLFLGALLGFLSLLSLDRARSDSESILRTWGDPAAAGRQLQFVLEVLPDGSGVTFLGHAIDGTNGIAAIEFQTGVGAPLGAGNVLAKCAAETCSALLLSADMAVGNNDFNMIATTKANGRFMVVGKIARP